mgnify:FL=1
MKKSKSYFLIIIFFLLSISNSLANNLAFIDLDLVLKNSNIGKEIYKKLEDQKETQIKDLKAREIKIKEIEEEIKNKQNIISKDDLAKEINKLKKIVNDFNIYKNEMEKEYQKSKNNEILNFFNKIDPLIQAYLSENSIDILFNNKNIIIGKDSLDITNKIITIVNSKIE